MAAPLRPPTETCPPASCDSEASRRPHPPTPTARATTRRPSSPSARSPPWLPSLRPCLCLGQPLGRPWPCRWAAQRRPRNRPPLRRRLCRGRQRPRRPPPLIPSLFRRHLPVRPRGLPLPLRPRRRTRLQTSSAEARGPCARVKPMNARMSSWHWHWLTVKVYDTRRNVERVRTARCTSSCVLGAQLQRGLST